jgi:hypothetical protein
MSWLIKAVIWYPFIETLRGKVCCHPWRSNIRIKGRGKTSTTALKASHQIHMSWQFYSNEKNGLQQIQTESCQPIKRLKDKDKKKKKKVCCNIFINGYLTMTFLRWDMYYVFDKIKLSQMFAVWSVVFLTISPVVDTITGHSYQCWYTVTSQYSMLSDFDK